MKITAVETIQVAEYSNLVWVELYTDQGSVGLGETFRSPAAMVAYIYATSAPYLLDPLQIERHARALMSEVGNHFMGFPSRSVEVRGTSAIDLALWTCSARGAACRSGSCSAACVDTIRIYNTCASTGQNRMVRAGTNSLLLGPEDRPTGGDPLDDLAAQHQRPAEFARSLLEDGITAMKIWPVDA